MKKNILTGTKIRRIIGIVAGAPLLLVLAYVLADRTNGQIISSGVRRKYLLYVPPRYDPTTPTPLVITIHGFAQWPANQRDISKWNTLADENGFIVVYPSGSGFPKRWGAHGITDSLNPQMQDVTFISDLIDKLESEYNIDPTRVYVNGLSNGGGMSYLLACKLSERIAAFGTVAGAHLYPLDACHPTYPVPMIAFHGTADPIVPYNGGPSRMFDIPFPVIPDWVARYAARNGCAATPVALPTQGEVSGIRYKACDAGAEVHFYTIHGGGHTWPGGGRLPKAVVGHTTQDIDATRTMWDFFKQYTRTR
ncbi:MAG TPA: PHB depolymerase family esterase [Anaerolineae bacterium]|nr:PHB depolymerase family esterase [Anaerolineae bacterium]HQK14758.1 PHB depolymerase family esterase [Anaerolineae bacterium]